MGRSFAHNGLLLCRYESPLVCLDKHSLRSCHSGRNAIDSSTLVYLRDEQPSSLAVVKGLPAFPRIGDASSIPSHLSGQVFSENHSNPGIIINSVAINSALNIDPTSVAHLASFEES